MSRIFEITEKVRSYHPKADIDLINRAYVFAAQAHAGQTRSSGEPYLVHPLAVAEILASLKLDELTIATGLLHDTVEDTGVTLEEIRERFGDEIALLVDGVTKIGRIRFRSSEYKQAENFRKMILATAKDLRVLIVKLADRLHNMRTLGFLPERKRRAIAEETMQLYAPLAHRLGIHWIKQELEDLSFAHLEPEAYREITQRLADHLDGLNRTRERLERIIQEALNRQGLQARVQGRMKHLYGIYEKMQRKHVDFDEIYDLVAFRIIVKDMPTCYQALGIIHSLYSPVPGRFKDYIALPKPNGYQSLHTTVIGPENYRIEIQIRTEAMHRYAEDGIAAHWLYKGGDALPWKDRERFRWLSQLMELLRNSEHPQEFLENARLDLFVQEVYVFSRDGDLFALPRGATPLDFAYAVHTDVGHHCIGVRINGEPADFETKLRNGDQVEVLVSPEQTPSWEWLRYVTTPKAKQAIRQWFRRAQREETMRLGEQILKEVLGKSPVLDARFLQAFSCSSIDDLKAKLGSGEIGIDLLIREMAKEGGALKISTKVPQLMRVATCCHPVPGDPVFGIFRSGQGILLHHRDCAMLKKEKGKVLEVRWKGEPGRLYSTAIEMKVENKRGMLAKISSRIAECGANIHDLNVRQVGGSMTGLRILIEVSNRRQLAQVFRAMRGIEGVSQVRRVLHGEGGKKTSLHQALISMMKKGWTR